MNQNKPILWMVIPCYNEEEALPITKKALEEKMKSLVDRNMIHKDSRVLLVNDGSSDKTWDLIQKYHYDNPLFNGINLSRNRGHQNALLAGLMTAKEFCDCAISMDADLQDDINAIDQMVDEYRHGADIVYGVRNKRETDTWFKRFTAETYYKVLAKMGANIIYNHADYRLMSKRALDALSLYGESNLFLRGIIPMIGFNTTTVEYERSERVAGESKYPLKKMVSFAFEGISSLSSTPIKWISRLGIAIFIVSIIMLIYFFIRYFTGNTVTGWASIVVSLWAIGGLILLSIGVIGEYIGKTYMETKHRPRFFIQDALLTETEKKNEEVEKNN